MKNSIVCLQWHYRNDMHSPSLLSILPTRLEKCDRYCNLNTIVHLATPLETSLATCLKGEYSRQFSKRTKPNKVGKQKITVVSSNQTSPKSLLPLAVVPGSESYISKVKILSLSALIEQWCLKPCISGNKKKNTQLVHFSFLSPSVVFRRTNNLPNK